MNIRALQHAAVALGYLVSAATASATFSFSWSGPGSASGGQTYTVTVSAYFSPNNQSDSGFVVSLNEQEGSGGDAATGLAYHTANASRSYSHITAQTYHYDGEAESYWGEYAISYRTVTVGQPNPPQISTSVPSSLTTGQSFTVSASASDPDGDLSTMGIRWQGSGLQGGDPGQSWWNISGYSASRTTPTLTAPSTPGTIYFRGEVWDSASNALADNWQPIPVYIAASFSFGTVTYNGSAQTVPVSASPAGTTYSLSGTTSATDAGTYTATATANGNYIGSHTGSWTIAKANQTISFGSLANKTYGDGPFSVSASASSGLAVSFSVLSGPATISGSTVTITGAGQVTIRASRGSSSNYNAAPSVDRSFEVNPQPTTFAISPTSFTSNGSPQGPTITPNPSAATWSVTAGQASATNVGNYSVIATATGNYTGTSGSVSWSIVAAPPDPPSPPTAQPPTNVTQTSFTANWSASAGANSYRLDVSTSNSFGTFLSGYQNLDTGNTTSTSVSGLSSGVTYYYRLRAENAGGTSASSNSQSATTLSAAPGAPTAGAATGITATSFTANWSAVSGATSYRLDVSTDAFATFLSGYNDLNTGNVTSSAVSGLAGNTIFHYRVRAVSAGGTSANSNAPSVTTAPVISLHPQNQAVAVSANASFSVTVTGPAALTYQWQRQPAGGSGFTNLANGGSYSGATTAALSVTAATAVMNNDQFRCIVTNPTTAVTSNAATLTVGSGGNDSTNQNELNVHLPVGP